MKKTDYLEKEVTEIKTQIKDLAEIVKTLRMAQSQNQQQN